VNNIFCTFTVYIAFNKFLLTLQFMILKTIIEGRLDFGSAKSYETTLKMYLKRLESHHRNDIFLKVENIFLEDQYQIVVSRFVKEGITEKAYKGTVALLEYCAQYAISGTIRAWLIDSGNILSFSLIEPKEDKVAVKLYQKGRQLVKQKGKQNEAIEELTKAIEKYDRHAQAYERRAKTCFLLQKYGDALRDYNKCLAIDPSIASAYYGRGRIHLHNKDFDAAVQDFDQAIKKSVALETIHFKARRIKAYTHMQLLEYDKAVYELGLVTKRTFKEGDDNVFWRRWALYYYGKALMACEKFDLAIDAFDNALKLPELDDNIKEIDLLRNRAICKKNAGKNGFLKDLKDALSKGDSQADLLLKEYQGKA
jgi:tetratricopeptide (TPR) repeat protein